MKSIVVPLNAFDRKEVLEKGQIAFIKLIAESGAYGVEIRRELFQVGDLPLKQLREEIAVYSLFTVYSTPVDLWKIDGSLNRQELEQIFKEASILGASWVKTSLGNYKEEISDSVELKKFLMQNEKVKLLVENDQTYYGGKLINVKTFFESVVNLNIPVNMTFDTGNWMYTGENAMEALVQLKEYIAYLHFKNVTQNGIELTTCAIDTSENAEWRIIASQFPSDLPKALEFPILPECLLREYVEMVENNKDMG